jgi:hypothetical protein
MMLGTPPRPSLYGKSLPEPPKALFARGTDFGLNIPDSARYGDGRLWYGRDDIIEEMRTQPRTRQDWSRTTEVVEKDGRTALQCAQAPWPEAQARAEEILAAWDEWQTTKQHTAEAVGLYEAEERKDEAREQVFEAFTAIMDTPATSLAGLLVKAQVALSLSHSVDGFSAYVDEFHENNGHSPETIGLAVLRDLLRLKGET